MAKVKAAEPTYEAGAKYTVRVSRPINVGPFEYLPRQEFEADGGFLNSMVEEHGADVIGSAERI